jgi:hypothetical protein
MGGAHFTLLVQIDSKWCEEKKAIAPTTRVTQGGLPERVMTLS